MAEKSLEEARLGLAWHHSEASRSGSGSAHLAQSQSTAR